jgi:hypothetical protein
MAEVDLVPRCKIAGCMRKLPNGNTSGVCRQHLHQEGCSCALCLKGMSLATRPARDRDAYGGYLPAAISLPTLPDRAGR